MKTGYLEIILLLLLVYFSTKYQPAMARHAHHRKQQGIGDCFHCPPGYGVLRHCNRHHDTECSPCPAEHYSSHNSARRPCYPCSRCGVGLYVAHVCTPTKDTVCDSCHTYKGPHNENFYERCVKPLLRTDNSNESAIQGQSSPLVKMDSLEAGVSRGIPTYVVIVAGVVIGTLVILLVVTCCVSNSKRHCKRVDHRYPYEAVATQEAVML